jgi:hypothetical protein
MPGWSAPRLYSALVAKGFRDAGGGGHEKLYLYADGEKTSVWVPVSRSDKKRYGGLLLTPLRRELRLESLGQVTDLVECPMSHDTYVSILKSRGIIARKGCPDAETNGRSDRQGENARGEVRERTESRRKPNARKGGRGAKTRPKTS